MIKKRKIIVTSVIITISLLMSCLIAAFAYVHTRDSNKDAGELGGQIYADGQAHDAGDSTAFPSSLVFSLTSDSTTGVSLTLNATVTPSTASNKAVDWSVAWASGASRVNEAVTDYITVTPSSDGSTTATVTCYKAFTGDNIVITVTTRSGGFTASCVCSFVGKPSSVSIDIGTYEVVTESDNVSKVKLDSGITHSFTSVYSNGFGTVGSSYKPSFEISTVSGIGEIVLKAPNKLNPAEAVGTTITMSLDEFIERGETFRGPEYLHAYIFDGSVLVINCGTLLENLYVTKGTAEYGDVLYEFDSFVGDIEPYVYIELIDSYTDERCSISVRLVSEVHGVSLSSTTLEY